MTSHDICQKAGIEGYDSLEDLALNLRSSWNHSTDAIWRQLDSELWELTHNPWAVLQSASRDKLTSLLADKQFSSLVKTLTKARKEALNSPSWFHDNHYE